MTRDRLRERGQNESVEVVIVGGSAAGLFAAYLLGREGRKVTVFDANDVFHVASRTLITTSELENVLGFFPDDAVVNKITRFELFSPSRSATISMRQPDLVVERAAMVRLLAHKAMQAGVEIRSGCKCLDVKPAVKGIRVTIQDTHRDRLEQISATTLIGADGAFSRIARMMHQNGHETAPLLQAIVSLPDVSLTHTTQVWFEPEDTPYFYWLIPEAHRQAAVGFIGQEGKHARTKLERFLARRGLHALDIQAARIPVYTHGSRPWLRISGCDIYFVGDAAGQVKVTTVGGLVTGLRGAQAAANAILGRNSYFKELRSLRRELSLHFLVRSVLNRFRDRDYDRLLELLNGQTLDLLGLYSRDRAATMLFRLLMSQPRFLSFSTLLSRDLFATRGTSSHEISVEKV